MKSKKLIEQFVKKNSELQTITTVTERYNEEYEGCYFDLNGKKIRSRLAKKTPTKTGYFVAFWEKDANDVNQPFDENDPHDYLLINIIDGNKQGQFVFPKEILIKQGILKSEKFKGKMAMRVYPSWETELNKTAVRTQKWQVPFFEVLL